MPFTGRRSAAHPGRFARHTALGRESIYEILPGERALVTAEAISVPGLARGSRVRLTAATAAAMERFDAPEPLAAAAAQV